MTRTWAGARGSERTPADLRDVIADAAMAGEQNVELRLLVDRVGSK
ncbi:MAG: hypothetical protein H6734_15045 [Alphaproteobacteria bacterium]|nr:hypothetical protein [Alphaproteobacteria bacterium]